MDLPTLDEILISQQYNFNDSKIDINISKLSKEKTDQLKHIKFMVENMVAYSIYYYDWRRYWKRAFWISTISAVILTASSSIINIFFDPCSDDEIVLKYNRSFGFIISICLGIIGVMKPSERAKDYELAGDKYNESANDLFRETLFQDGGVKNANLGNIISKYSVIDNNNREVYNEPSIDVIEKIKHSNRFKLRTPFRLLNFKLE